MSDDYYKGRHYKVEAFLFWVLINRVQHMVSDAYGSDRCFYGLLLLGSDLLKGQEKVPPALGIGSAFLRRCLPSLLMDSEVTNATCTGSTGRGIAPLSSVHFLLISKISQGFLYSSLCKLSKIWQGFFSKQLSISHLIL